MKKIDELRAMSLKGLEEELLSLRKEQFDYRLKKASDALDKTHHIGLVRRSVARVKTVMTEKEAGLSDDK